MSYLDLESHCILSILYLVLIARILAYLLLYIDYLEFAAGLQEFGISVTIYSKDFGLFVTIHRLPSIRSRSPGIWHICYYL